MKFFCYVVVSLYCLNAVCAQDSIHQHLQQLPGKYFAQINSKSHHFERQVSKRLEKALSKLASSSGPTDPGDIVFQHNNGTEYSRIYNGTGFGALHFSLGPRHPLQINICQICQWKKKWPARDWT